MEKDQAILLSVAVIAIIAIVSMALLAGSGISGLASSGIKGPKVTLDALINGERTEKLVVNPADVVNLSVTTSNSKQIDSVDVDVRSKNSSCADIFPSLSSEPFEWTWNVGNTASRCGSGQYIIHVSAVHNSGKEFSTQIYVTLENQ